MFDGKYLKRRSFLRGAGITIGLPLLDAMIPAFARAQTVTKPRVVYMYFPNGVYEGSFRPTGTGAGYTMPPLLAGTSLNAHKQDISFVTGLKNKWGTYDFGDGSGDHPRGISGYLTGARPFKSMSTIEAGVSVDVLLANAFGMTPLNLTAPGSGPANDGYNEAYTTNLSWTSKTTPSSRFDSPRAAFSALFGSGTPAPTPVLNLDKNVLDFVHLEAKTLKTRLTASDGIKLDEYLTSIESVQKQMKNVSTPMASCSSGTAPGTGLNFEAMTKAYMDLIILALTCNQRSIITYYMDWELNHRPFTWLGINDSHHVLSHYKDSTSYGDKFKKITQWYADQFAYIIAKMKMTSDAGGTLFDNSIVIFGSGMESGHEHGDYNLPVMYAGRGAGRVRVGEVISAGTSVPISNFHLSLLQKYGVSAASFGDSTGTISL